MMLHQRGVDSEVGTQPGAYGGGTLHRRGRVGGHRLRHRAPPPAPCARRSALTNAVVAVDMAVSPDGKQLAVVARPGNAGTDQQLHLLLGHRGDQATRRPEKPCVAGGRTVPPMADPMPTRPRTDGAPEPNRVPAAQRRGHRGGLRQRGATSWCRAGSRPRCRSSPSGWRPSCWPPSARPTSGHQLFHAATTGKLACASCHPEGGEDGRTWKFVGSGRAPDAVAARRDHGHGPVPLERRLPSLDHLMHDVFEGRMAGRPARSRAGAVPGALAGQVPTIKPSRWHATGGGRARPGAVRELGRRLRHLPQGRRLHQRQQLRRRHRRGLPGAPAAQPGLPRAVHARRLRHHAGRSLHGKCGGDDRHGLTSQLTRPQIADLIAYLESL